MAYPLRMYEPDRVYEITVNTLQGRYLLLPSPESKDLINGVIGRAQAQFPKVNIFAYVFLSTHATWLASSPEPDQLPAFMGFVNCNVSKELGKLHDWPGKLWARPHRPIPIVDNDALIARMTYLLSQGCKEGLVDSPYHWPGASTTDALCHQTPLRGTWHDRDLESKAATRIERLTARSKKRPCDFQTVHATTYTVELAKLPCYAHLNQHQYATQMRKMVKSIEAQTALANRSLGRRSLGAKAVCAYPPHHRPETLDKSPAPLCHASSSQERRRFRDIYRAFVAAFRHAAQQLKDGVLDVVFPDYCFPPRRGMPLPAT